jgi:hypothetical protein
VAVRVGYAGTQSVGDVLTSANFTKMPNANVGIIQTSASDQGSITTETAVTGLSVAPTIGTSRYVRARCRLWFSCTSVCVVLVRIKADGTLIDSPGQAYIGATGGPGQHSQEFTVWHTPTAGAHTYTVTVTPSAGTLSIINSTSLGTLEVEDVGPAF